MIIRPQTRARSPQFSGGLQLPLAPSDSGGLQLLTGDEYLLQTVETLCDDSSSENPFNDGGIGQDPIFANASDTAWKTKALDDIRTIFVPLRKANLCRLLTADIQQGAAPDQQDCTVRFLSIESNTVQEVTTTLRRVS